MYEFPRKSTCNFFFYERFFNVTFTIIFQEKFLILNICSACVCVCELNIKLVKPTVKKCLKS